MNKFQNVIRRSCKYRPDNGIIAVIGDVQASTEILRPYASSQRDCSVKSQQTTSVNSLANRVENAVASATAGVKSAFGSLSLNMAVA